MAERRLRVCMVAPFAPRKGGVTVQTELLTRYLEESGVEVLRVDTNLQWLRVRGLGFLRLLLQPFVVLGRLLRLVPKCDIVHFQAASYWGYMPTVLGAPIGRLLRKRMVISYQGGLGGEFMRRLPWLVKPSMRMVTVVCTCSDELRAAFGSQGVDAVQVNNLFDAKLFQFRERPRIGPHIVWTRSFEEIYDPLAAIEVFERVRQRYPEATLVMTSNGSLMQSVRDRIAEHQLTGVTLTGRVPTEQVAQIMHDGDICLNTSKVDGLPTALLEAAASGLPIVTTNAGGIPALFSDGASAVIVEAGDVDAMTDAVLALLDDPARACAAGRAARDVALAYTWEKVSVELEKVYGLRPGQLQGSTAENTGIGGLR